MTAALRSTTYGDLNCRVTGPVQGETPRLLVVLSHGFGAPGTDLVPLADELRYTSPEIGQHVRFVFPEAPLDLGPMGMPGGRAWWSINMAQLAAMNQTHDFSQLTEIEPDGLRTASSQLSESVAAMLEDAGLSNDQLFLGGFSQGAMVSTDVVLRTGLRPATLILMSGTLLCRADWTEMAARHAGCPVIQTHGSQDMVLPIEPSGWLRDILVDNGFEVDYSSFAGPHTVPAIALQKTARAIVEHLRESGS